MIYSIIEKFNKNDFEKITKGEWFDRNEMYLIWNALEEYKNKLLPTLTEEAEILYDMTIEKVKSLINEDLRKE